VTDVSVIVPVFNKAPYLPELLASLRAQTHASFDVWLVDDGSDDGSEVLCDRAAAADARFHVIHQENSGWPGRPRNVGIDASDGTYLFFADADDWCEPTLLADLVGFAEEHGSDVVLPAVLSEGHSYTAREPVLSDEVDVDPREAFLTLTPHKLFRRAYFEGLGLRFTEDKVPLEDGQLVAEAYVGGGRISRCGHRLGYHYMGREGTNISYAPRDPLAHAHSVSTILRSARRVAVHADEIIVDMYRRKMLRYLGPNYLPRMGEEQQQGWVLGTASVAEHFIPVDLEATLTAWPRLASRTARLREPELSVAVAQARLEGAVPAERVNGHWFIGPVPVDDLFTVRVVAKKVVARGVRVKCRPEWIVLRSPRLEIVVGEDRYPLVEMMEPTLPVPAQGPVIAAWDDVEVPVEFDGEEVLHHGLRLTGRDGQLLAGPA
jgi:glycosyltransferase involved in cell wall biosynthesis